MEAGSPDFDSTLQKLIGDGNARRAKIELIEKIEIGRINARMTELRVKGRGSAESQKQIAELDAKYNVLATEAKALRLKQNDDQLILKLPNGSEKSVAIGNIIFAYLPESAWFLLSVGNLPPQCLGLLDSRPP